jgi:hypothetical protein
MLSIWNFTEQYTKGNTITYMDATQGAVLYDAGSMMSTDDLELVTSDKHFLYKMPYFIAHNLGYFIKAATLKIWYLMSGARQYYSNLNNLSRCFW